MLALPLSVLVWLPLAAGVVGLLLPARWARWLVLLAALCDLGFVIALLVDFPTHGAGLHYVTDDKWIPAIGIRYHLGVSGLNLFLIALTAVLWVPATFVAALREWDRPRLFFFNLALAETAVLGAFVAQDLVRFVAFFDRMLVPFYFLIGAWGGPRRVEATTKFVIYTLVGSLLMLAGAIALGVIATPSHGKISFEMAVLAHRHLATGTQEWLFLLFAAAFLVEMPFFPFPGLMPDTDWATPLSVLGKKGIFTKNTSANTKKNNY